MRNESDLHYNSVVGRDVLAVMMLLDRCVTPNEKLSFFVVFFFLSPDFFSERSNCVCLQHDDAARLLVLRVRVYLCALFTPMPCDTLTLTENRC